MSAVCCLLRQNKAYNQHLHLPEYYQNVFELLGDATHGRPGDFYLDLGTDPASTTGHVYYVTAAAAKDPIHAVLPQLELLVNAGPGTADLTWTDVTFAEATWLLPSTEVGFVEMQAGCTVRRMLPFSAPAAVHPAFIERMRSFVA